MNPLWKIFPDVYMKYQFVLDAITSPEDLGRISEEAINEYRSAGYPNDYIDFLKEVGFGNLDEIQVYQEPTFASEIYPERRENLSKVRLIGDDMQGYCFGYNCDEMILVEVTPQGVIKEMAEPSFASLLDSYFKGGC